MNSNLSLDTIVTNSDSVDGAMMKYACPRSCRKVTAVERKSLLEVGVLVRAEAAPVTHLMFPISCFAWS